MTGWRARASALGVSPRQIRRLCLGAVFFVGVHGATLADAAPSGVQGRVTAQATSLGDLPRVTALATTDPEVLYLLDADGRLLRQQLLRDRTARQRSAVCALWVLPQRQSFVVVFSDMPELWEVSYNPVAPEISLGMVHDFQYREGQFAPGYLHPQRSSLPFVVGRVALGADGHSLVLEPRSNPGQPPAAEPVLLHLDVRKPIQEPATAATGWTVCSL